MKRFLYGRHDLPLSKAKGRFPFKELMQNPKVRQGFIAALLKVDPKTVEETTLLPTVLSCDSEDGKLGILEVRVKLNDSTQIDMEMQVAQFDAWKNRIIFYLCKMYTEQLKKGESYDKLKKCIHVSILDFKHFPDDAECYRTITLRDNKTCAIYNDLLEIQILELRKLPKEMPEENEDVISWMRSAVQTQSVFCMDGTTCRRVSTRGRFHRWENSGGLSDHGKLK